MNLSLTNVKNTIEAQQIEVADKTTALSNGYVGYKWLIGDPKDVDWYFIENLKGQYVCRLKLTWKPTFKDEGITTTMRWTKWTEIGKSLCINLFESRKSITKSGSKKILAQDVKYICQFFCFERQIMDISDVDASDITAFENHLEKKELSIRTVATYLRTLQRFWTSVSTNWSGLTFCPYPSSRPIGSTAKQLGVKNGHTKTLLPETGLHLLDHALNLISTSAKTLNNYDLYRNLKSQKKDHAAIYFKKTNQKANKLITEVRMLYSAAIVITLTLTAMRKHELSAILHQDAVDMVEGLVDVLTGRVHKTAKVLNGKETKRKSTTELKDALNVIIRLTQDVRDKTNNELLILRLSTHNSEVGDHNLIPLGSHSLYILLDLFCESAGYAEGTLRPHMFRRFFAMMWAWRFEVGDLHYLSKLLYHNGYEFTTAYTEDENVWEFMTDEMKALTHSIFQDILTKEKQLVGGFSRTLERYIRLIQAKVSIVNPDHISDFVHALVERSGYVVVPADDGYCFMSPARASSAKCSTNGVQPDYANRNENLCGGCPNLGVSAEKIGIWERRLNNHTKIFKTTQFQYLKDAALKGVVLTQRMINSIAFKEIQ
jgi:integrase